MVSSANPTGGHYRPRVIIDEREKVGFMPVQPDRVQCVAGPDLVRPVCLEPAERRCGARRDQRGQPGPVEHPLDRPLIGCPPGLRLEDPLDLRRGPGRVLLSSAPPPAPAPPAGSAAGTGAGAGTSASNPPLAPPSTGIHTSSVHRVTRTGCPDGPACSRAASSRTIAPRCREVSAGSAASRISMYRTARSPGPVPAEPVPLLQPCSCPSGHLLRSCQ